MGATSTEAASSSPSRRRQQPYPAEKARQGEIILKSQGARVIFLIGLFGGLVILGLLVIYLGIVS